MPEFRGRAIRIRLAKADLCVRRGKLVSGSEGETVHAASFLNKRLIVLEGGLRCNPNECRRILIHELFHFLWRRLGNRQRWEFEAILDAEHREGARGELGWSAEWRKLALQAEDRSSRNRRWREYVAESFCDTAAYYFRWESHAEHTLRQRFCRRREKWFERLLGSAPLPL